MKKSTTDMLGKFFEEVETVSHDRKCYLIKNVAIIGVYEFYDKPLIFIAQVPNTEKRIFYMVYDDESYLACPLIEIEYKNLINNEVTMRDFLSSQYIMYLVTNNSVEIKEFDEDCFPDQWKYLVNA